MSRMTRLLARSIVVANLGIATAFYRDVFGFAATTVFEGSGAELDAITQIEGVSLRAQMMQDADGVVIELVEFLSPRCYERHEATTVARFGLTHLAFAVDDVDAARARVIAAGGHVADGRRVKVARDAIQMEAMMVFDPDGVLIEIAAIASQRAGFLWNGIGVRDIDRATDYYRLLGFEPAERFDLREGAAWLDRLNAMSGVQLLAQILRNNAGDAIELIKLNAPAVTSPAVPKPYGHSGLAGLAFLTDRRDRLGADLRGGGGAMFDAARLAIEVNRERLLQWHGIDPDGARIELIEHP